MSLNELFVFCDQKSYKEVGMQNVIQYPIRRFPPETKRITEKIVDIQFLFRPEIVARDGRYVAYANRVVCDCYSGLEWLPGPDKDMSWEAGCRWVNGLSTGGGGWRLPTLGELRGLFKKNKKGDNLSPLFETDITDIWSCEIQDEESAWGFNFLPGNQFWTYKTSSVRFRVLAVRSRKYPAFTKEEKMVSD
jgi:hypothetical protein